MLILTHDGESGHGYAQSRVDASGHGTSAIADADRLLANGIGLTASFTYDPSIVATATDVDLSANPALAPYGLFSIYPGAITDFTVSIAGNVVSTPTATVLVGNNGPGVMDGVFGSADVSTPGWSGFSIGNFVLSNLTIFTVGLPDMFADQSLAATWQLAADIPFGINSGINLSFRDVTGASQNRLVQVWNPTLTARPVPEPGTFGLLGAGLLLMGFIRRRRAA